MHYPHPLSICPPLSIFDQMFILVSSRRVSLYTNTTPSSPFLGLIAFYRKCLHLILKLSIKLFQSYWTKTDILDDGAGVFWSFFYKLFEEYVEKRRHFITNSFFSFVNTHKNFAEYCFLANSSKIFASGGLCISAAWGRNSHCLLDFLSVSTFLFSPKSKSRQRKQRGVERILQKANFECPPR